MTGLQRLPNGNTVMTNWLGHDRLGTAPHIIDYSILPSPRLSVTLMDW